MISEHLPSWMSFQDVRKPPKQKQVSKVMKTNENVNMILKLQVTLLCMDLVFPWQPQFDRHVTPNSKVCLILK